MYMKIQNILYTFLLLHCFNIYLFYLPHLKNWITSIEEIQINCYRIGFRNPANIYTDKQLRHTSNRTKNVRHKVL